jgi:hypothetical protein
MIKTFASKTAIPEGARPKPAPKTVKPAVQPRVADRPARKPAADATPEVAGEATAAAHALAAQMERALARGETAFLAADALQALPRRTSWSPPAAC